MVKSALRDKDKKVLNLVIESFVRHGRPVSSGAISQTRRITASPATLRNIMAKLEAMGYLSQPHTSAGRVPTDKGLRYYVGRLLAEKALPEERVPGHPGGIPQPDGRSRFPPPPGLPDPGRFLRRPGLRHLAAHLPPAVRAPAFHQDLRPPDPGHPRDPVPHGPDGDARIAAAPDPGRARPGLPVRQPEFPRQDDPRRPRRPGAGAAQAPDQVRGHPGQAPRPAQDLDRQGRGGAHLPRRHVPPARARAGCPTWASSGPSSEASRRRPPWSGCSRISSAWTGSRS